VILSFDHSLPSTASQSWRAAAQATLSARGFVAQPAPSSTGGLTLRRGSLWGNLFGFRMDRLAQELRVNTEPEPGGGLRVSLHYEIDTRGQFVSAADLRFFEEEAAAVAQALAGDSSGLGPLAAYPRRARRKMAALLLGLAAMGAALGGLLGLLPRLLRG